jgi:hypothetical protein
MNGDGFAFQHFPMNHTNEVRELSSRRWSAAVWYGEGEEPDTFCGAQRRLGLKVELSNFSWLKQRYH